ncbi:Glycine cleavage system transcriptional activator [compost metagenome]
MLIQAVIADMGVALVQRCLVKEALQSGAVVVPFDLPIALQRGYYLCTPHDRRPRPGFEQFRRWLLDAAAADIEAMGIDAPPG